VHCTLFFREESNRQTIPKVKVPVQVYLAADNKIHGSELAKHWKQGCGVVHGQQQRSYNHVDLVQGVIVTIYPLSSSYPSYVGVLVL